MNRQVKTRGPVLWALGYAASFIPFAMTSVFHDIQSALGSMIAALLLINSVAAILVLLIVPMGVEVVSRVMLILSGLYGIPVVFAYSRLDWLKRIFGLSFSCSLPGVLAALLLLISLAVNLWNWNLSRWAKRCRQWEEKGAAEEEAAQVSWEQALLFRYLLGAVSIFIALVIVLGFVVFQLKQGLLQPVWVLVFGLILLGGCGFYLTVVIRKYMEQKE